MEDAFEACLRHYLKQEWGSAQHYARMCAEAVALALLERVEGWASEKKPPRTLEVYTNDLQRHLRIDVPLQRAFQMVQVTGIQGSHVQRPTDAPNARGAELCTSNLVIIVEWFLEQTAVPSERAMKVAKELRQRFAQTGSGTSSLSLQGFAQTPPQEPDDGGHARRTPMPENFADWYQDVRHELQTLFGETIDQLEKREGWVHPDGRATPALHVCVVGQAAVGKSTLVNCLVSNRLAILPAGGVGPYTASAIVVRYSTDPHAEVRYVARDRVDALLRELHGRDPSLDALAAARILVEGNQFGRLGPARLAQALEEILHSARPPDDPTRFRVWSVLSAIRAGNRTVRFMAGEDLPGFSKSLELHASGALAPLTEAVEVGWDTEILSPGLCLVDLPGFGVSGDKHSLVSKREIARARAVLWVVDRSGLTEGTLQELKKIELFRRLASEDDDTPVLTIAVTRLDETASDARKRSQRDRGSSFDECLEEVGAAARAMIRGQLRDAVGHLEPRERERVQERVAVHPVAPVEYRRVHLRDEEEPARVSDEGRTGILQLRRHLRSLAARRRARAATQIFHLLQGSHAPALVPLARRLLAELQIVTPDRTPQGQV